MLTVNDRRAFTLTEIINGRLQPSVAIDGRGAALAIGANATRGLTLKLACLSRGASRRRL
jgi:hypothetical protein